MFRAILFTMFILGFVFLIIFFFLIGTAPVSSEVGSDCVTERGYGYGY